MFQTLWSRRIGRVVFAVNFVGVAALIFLLPGVVRVLLGGLLTSTYKLSPHDPATGIVAVLLYVPVTHFALLALFVWLLFAARARLRDVGLSGAFLLLFPLLAFEPLWGAVVGQLGALMLLSPPASPLLDPRVVLSLALGGALAVAPADAARSSSRAWQTVQSWTDCDGAISRKTFIWRTTPVLAAFLLLYLAPLIWVVVSRSVFSAVEPSLVGWAAALHPWRNPGVATAPPMATLWLPALLSATGILRALLSVVLLSLTVRRLHGLGRTGFEALFFPLSLSPAAAIGASISTIALMSPSLMPVLKPLFAPVTLQGVNVGAVPALVIDALVLAVLAYLYAGPDKAIAGAQAEASRLDQRPSLLRDPALWAACVTVVGLLATGAIVAHIGICRTRCVIGSRCPSTLQTA